MAKIQYQDIRLKKEGNKWFYTKDDKDLVEMIFFSEDDMQDVFCVDPASILSESLLDCYMDDGDEFNFWDESIRIFPESAIYSTYAGKCGKSLLSAICSKAEHDVAYVEKAFGNPNFEEHFAIIEMGLNGVYIRGFVKCTKHGIKVAVNPDYVEMYNKRKHQSIWKQFYSSEFMIK